MIIDQPSSSTVNAGITVDIRRLTGLPEVGVRHFYPRNFNNAATRSKEEEEKLVKERKVVLRDVNITPDLVLGRFVREVVVVVVVDVDVVVVVAV